MPEALPACLSGLNWVNAGARQITQIRKIQLLIATPTHVRFYKPWFMLPGYCPALPNNVISGTYLENIILVYRALKVTTDYLTILAIMHNRQRPHVRFPDFCFAHAFINTSIKKHFLIQENNIFKHYKNN